MNPKTRQQSLLDALEAKLAASPQASLKRKPLVKTGSAEVVLPKGTIKVSDMDADVFRTHWKVDCDGYAATEMDRAEARGTTRLHRLIMGRAIGRWLDASEIVDHINGIKLDNRRENLRIVTHAENQRNIHTARGSSGFVGVTKKRNRWLVRVTRKEAGRSIVIYRKTFSTPQEAALAYRANAQ